MDIGQVIVIIGIQKNIGNIFPGDVGANNDDEILISYTGNSNEFEVRMLNYSSSSDYLDLREIFSIKLEIF